MHALSESQPTGRKAILRFLAIISPVILLVSALPFVLFNKKDEPVSHMPVLLAANETGVQLPFRVSSQIAAVPATPTQNLKSLQKPLISGNKLYLSRFSRYTSGDTLLKKAKRLFEQKKYIEARSLLQGSTSPYAQYWLCKTYLKTGDYQKVIALVPRLKGTLFLLKERLVLFQIEAYVGMKSYENALLLTDLLAKGNLRLEALTNQVSILERLKKPQRLLGSVRALLKLKRLPRGDRSRMLLKLASLTPSNTEAKESLLQVWTMGAARGTLAKANTIARTRLKKPLAKLTRCSHKVERAMRLSRYNLHRLAIKTLNKSGTCSRADRCKRDFTLARSYFFLKKYKKSSSLAGRAVLTCEKTPLKTLRVKAKYLAGKSAYARRRYKTALKVFRRAAKEHPDHSYADDALHKMALTYEKMGDSKKAIQLMNQIVKRYPKGDRANDAMWGPVLGRLERGDWKTANALLNNARSRLTPTPPLEAWGRIIYWQGRTLHLMGKTAQAGKHYKECVALAPVTYHALLSLNRLEEISAGSGKKLLAAMITRSTPGNIPWPLLSDPLFASDGFARFVELARLGDTQSALDELLGLGVPIPQKPGQIKNRTFLKGVALLLHMSGIHHKAYSLMGRALMDHAHSWPAADKKILWAAAYPMLYKSLITTNAKGAGIPPSVLAGLVREESGFSPRIRSTAGALGLAQIMPRTAAYIAKKLKIAYNNKNDLAKPAVNLAIAAGYLKKLKRLFKGRLPLYVGAYNCGETAMRRWRRKAPKLPLDLFVEMIQVSETRNYIKRVLSSIFTYHLLMGKGGFPTVGLQ